MRSILDESVFKRAIIDNGSLATLSSIVHKVGEQGFYRGIVFSGEAKK